MPKVSRNIGLDPKTQYLEIYRNLSNYEFPWDINQSLSFALFRTYAVPSIGALLDETSAFTGDTQKRYDDTGLLLEAPLQEGFDSRNGKAAMRRVNQMHHMYDISNDDFRYVLSTFVVVPTRWIADYGWRQLAENEIEATVRYYQDLGRHMAIKDIPATYAEFETLMDEYEAVHFAFDPGGRRVADSTMALMTSFYPRFAARGVELFSRGLMDKPLIDAFRFRDPGDRVRKLSAAALRARARFVAILPRRRDPLLVRNMRRIRSYPNGFQIERMGTFGKGCPVAHDAPQLSQVRGA